MSVAQTEGRRLRVVLADADATDVLARTLARTMPTTVAPAVVFLHGDLGAGKSTLARAWLRALGVQGAIRSPTYTLVERYVLNNAGDAPTRHAGMQPEVGASASSLASALASAPREALHLDLYRIGSGGELEFLGLDDVPAALWLVEWPERGEGGLPGADLHVRLSLLEDGAEGRVAALEAATEEGQIWLERLTALVQNDGLHPFPEA
jgi:tRNA threonylcarbamoyladenosine biosynthesis protein TsaE